MFSDKTFPFPEEFSSTIKKKMSAKDSFFEPIEKGLYIVLYYFRDILILNFFPVIKIAQVYGLFPLNRQKSFTVKSLKLWHSMLMIFSVAFLILVLLIELAIHKVTKSKISEIMSPLMS